MENKKLSLQLSQNQAILKNLAFKFTSDADEVQDLVQETMIRSIKYLDGLFGSPKMISWLYVIMKNVYINQYRRAQKQTKYENSQLANFRNDGYNEPFTHNNVEGSLVMKDIEQVFQELPEEYYELFMRYSDGYKYRELSIQFGMPEGTIKTRIHRIKKHLQSRLEIYRKDR